MEIIARVRKQVNEKKIRIGDFRLLNFDSSFRNPSKYLRYLVICFLFSIHYSLFPKFYFNDKICCADAPIV